MLPPGISHALRDLKESQIPVIYSARVAEMHIGTSGTAIATVTAPSPAAP